MPKKLDLGVVNKRDSEASEVGIALTFPHLPIFLLEVNKRFRKVKMNTMMMPLKVKAKRSGRTNQLLRRDVAAE